MPLPTPTDEDIDAVREVAGELDADYVAALIDNLNDSQWSRALDFVTAWNDYDVGDISGLEGGREGVKQSNQLDLDDIRKRMRLLLGLPELRDLGITGGAGTVSVPSLWVW